MKNEAKLQSKYVGASSLRTIACSLVLVVTTAAAVATSRDAAAQAGDESAETRNCVDLMQIGHTEIVDDNTVLFYMRNGTLYRNELQHACPTLGFEERFMYRTALTQLCDI